MAQTPWVLETRPQFLTLSVVLVIHGALLGLWQGSFDWLKALLAMIALVLLQASANVLNDWHDAAKSGIDYNVRRTPFSGGSGLVTSGAVTERQALLLGVGLLVAGGGIGLYLSWVSGWQLLVIGLIGVASIVAYTPVCNRIGLGEFAAGFVLGTLPVVATYFLMTGRIDAVAWMSGVPAGLLTYNLLFLNEFPDAEADAKGRRRHMVILLGKKTASRLYAAVEVGAYAAVAIGVAWGVLTPWALLALAAAIFAYRAIAGILVHYDGFEAVVPLLGANVAAVLATNVLLGVGYLVAAFVG